MTERTVVLHLANVKKSFGKRQVLNGISFDAFAGEVFGFVGPNGAGKTTTIKLLTGLLSIDEGEISIMGHDMKTDFEKAMAHVGGIVENPELYGYMSGLDNLKMYARLYGVGEVRIWEVVRLVGMEARIRDKVSKYSLGMRQRLGVAMALLHRPRLLVLDEPTNGLDPSGIKALRETLVRLAHEEGVAVFVSSHLMSEMEQMCDRIGVIVNGVLESVREIGDLVLVGEKNTVQYTVAVNDPVRASALLCGMEGTEVCVTEAGDVLVTLLEAHATEGIAAVNRALILGGIDVYTVTERAKRKLEDVYIEMTREGGGGIV